MARPATGRLHLLHCCPPDPGPSPACAHLPGSCSASLPPSGLRAGGRLASRRATRNPCLPTQAPPPTPPPTPHTPRPPDPPPTPYPRAPAAALVVMVASCSLAVLVNVSQFMCLGRFSAVSFQVGPRLPARPPAKRFPEPTRPGSQPSRCLLAAHTMLAGLGRAGPAVHCGRPAPSPSPFSTPLQPYFNSAPPPPSQPPSNPSPRTSPIPHTHPPFRASRAGAGPQQDHPGAAGGLGLPG